VIGVIRVIDVAPVVPALHCSAARTFACRFRRNGDRLLRVAHLLRGVGSPCRLAGRTRWT